VLVPVDFSEMSRKALLYAVSFAKQFGAKIVLLHVVEPLPAPPEVVYLETGAINTEARKGAEKQLSVWRQAVAAGASVTTKIRTGVAYREIVEAAKAAKADLIVLSTHGRTGLAHLFMGSTAERVVREATCPVLVVRSPEREFVSASPSKRGSSSRRRGGESFRVANRGVG
jgi:universal stress protein A